MQKSRFIESRGGVQVGQGNVLVKARIHFQFRQVDIRMFQPEGKGFKQGLGYFVDLHEIKVPDRVRAALLELVRPQSKIQLGPRRKWGTSGKLVRPWNVVQNVPRDVLVSKDEKPRRRVFFAKKEQSK